MKTPRHTLTVACVLLAVLAACTFAWAEAASALLEKGLYMENTAGNLESAMTVYGQIIANAEAGRPFVAQAHYRLGMCHLKKGNKAAATQAFRKVLTDFPSETATVEKATTQLRKLGVIAETPPVVLRTHPAAFANDVSPSAKRITVTFSRPMMDKSWSWTGGGPTFPKTTGTPRYDKRKTACMLPVALEPGKVYWVGVNSPSHTHFQTPTRVAAQRYVILFATQAADGRPTPLPEKMVADAKRINARVATAVTAADRVESETFAAKGWQLWNQGKMAEAEKLFAEAVRKNPANANAWNGQGWSQFNLGRPMAAAESFRKCLDLAPQHAAALNGLGWIAKKEGKAGEAIVYWEKAVTASPRTTAALSGLATTYTELGRHKEAVGVYEKWLAVEPASAQAQEGLKKAKASAKVMEKREDKVGLNILPAPWVDGERMRLALKSLTGMELGTMIYAAELGGTAPREHWRIDSSLLVAANNSEQFTRVEADRKRFTPITGWTKNQLGDFRATYSPKKVLLSATHAGSTSSREIELSETAYDNEQVIYLIRRLPLAEGYKASFPIFPVQGGMVVECRIEVVAKETLSVPAGRYECHKLLLSVYVGTVRSLQHTLWYSADDHRTLVKYDSGAAVMELTEVGTTAKNKAAGYVDEAAKFSLKAPAGWGFYKHANPGRAKFTLQLLPPELMSWGIVTAVARGTALDSARQAAQGDIAVLKGYFKNYVVRPDSWPDLRVSDLPAAHYIADYQDKGQEMVEHRTYILGKSHIYWFVFRVEKGAFDAVESVFDAIVKSFSVREG